MRIEKMSPRVGAIVEGIDARAINQSTFEVLYRTWLECNVLVVRGQDMKEDEFLSYSRRFGSIVPHPSKSTRHPDYPEITLLGVNKYDVKGKLNMDVYKRGAAGWHTDGAYDVQPFKATQLYAVAVPSKGGNTMFASMYAAYDALPAPLKERVEGRQGEFVYGGRSQDNKLLNREDRSKPPALHPLVREHSETGRKALYFDPGKILRIKGLAAGESDKLIDALTDKMIQANSEYHHEWKKGDIVIWDNRCSYQKAAGDYPPEEDRIHWRVSIKETPN
ncbi:MAG: TauD/TfdA dioxygenase family protein [Hyphomicrobiaceae bacterium]